MASDGSKGMLYMTPAAAALAADRTELTETSGRVKGKEEGVRSLFWDQFTQTGQSFGSGPG